MSKRLELKSSKQLVRLWFEFYKLALQDQNLYSNFEQSKKFYEPWGDIFDINFDKWYKTHNHLFLFKVIEINNIVRSKNVLNVSIPLSQTIPQTIKQLRELLIEKQSVIRPNSYEFTKGIKINGKTLYEILVIYKIWLDLNQPAINSNFINEVVTQLQNRPRSKWIPYIIQIKPKRLLNGSAEYSDDQIRQIRRYINKAKNICKSVSLGEFPGKSSLV